MEDLIICRCKEVTQSEIERAIDEGATTVDGVKRRTKACMGLCQGKTCTRLIQNIIAKKTGIPPAEIMPGKSRMPARPVNMGAFGGKSDE